MILILIYRNCEKGIQLFPSEEDALVFLEDYDLDEARATMLRSRGKPLEAAEAHARDGKVLEAVEVLLECDAPSIEESKMAVRYVLAGLWKRMSFGIRFRKSDVDTTSLLQISPRLDPSAMTEDQVDEVRSIQPLGIITPLTLEHISSLCSNQLRRTARKSLLALIRQTA